MVAKGYKLKVISYKLIARSILVGLLLLTTTINAQLKYVVEDFEGFTDGAADLKANGVFTFGNIKAAVINDPTRHSGGSGYSGNRFLGLSKNGNLDYGGWGKGIGLNIELYPSQDYLNFYVSGNSKCIIKIELQEDDNGNSVYEKNLDDAWDYTLDMKNLSVPADKNNWNLVSIPLYKFKDSNPGGDGIFNVNYKQGKLICLVISFIDPSCFPGSGNVKNNNTIWSFDFICFSKGKLPTGKELFDPPFASKNDFCSLGAWSKEGNTANFTDIASGFESNFKCDKKLGVVHFFQPFAVDGGSTENHYPSVERINKVIQEGYIPMITLEDHFVNLNPNIKQPNLYSIVEGHLDPFFKEWAKQIKQVKGTILLRILHEFNGDWYPWCIANNDKNPQLFIKAFIHIHDIFTAQNVKNVKFIWCPNSMSLPQERWNFIMDAYPGDEYVDYVGLDIYNGAGKGALWRSFRKEGIENYYVLTEQLPNKPLFVCETASRERENNESKPSQNKAEWIKQMSDALNSDMSKVRILTWFNEKSTFKINTSPEAKNAFQDYVLKNDHFKSGTEHVYQMLSH